MSSSEELLEAAKNLEAAAPAAEADNVAGPLNALAEAAESLKRSFSGSWLGYPSLVMTAEDELADGAVQARMNVVHEAGLFQGRLGFTKGIVLLEEGCSEFSSIQGLGQIRFPKGKLSAAFAEIRRVVEREGLIGPLV